ncbi:GTPase IMAP family member 8-like [Kryptolebias marmoratus]|uniref:GTPase IMAP family member 8-like n=1 Tax=Kryptolebias marmoratus TaxID=37003 RepID=A0A3Q3F7A4_KRYMA|nr:GTPase IMAP family member 8-like [Kryptolebias marmoratus]
MDSDSPGPGPGPDPGPDPGPSPGPGPDLTIILLGNSGVGKSASGNTILGRVAFESKASFTTSKVPIRQETEKVFGKLIQVIDTPGILESEGLIRSCCEEVLRTPGPHLFLLVVKADRFTAEQKKAVEAAIRVVGEPAFRSCFLLFTYGDSLKNTSLEDFIFSDDQSSLPEVARRFSKRFHLFNNEDKGGEQVRALLLRSGHLQDASPGGSNDGRNHRMDWTVSVGGSVGSEDIRNHRTGPPDHVGGSFGPGDRRILLIGPVGGGKSSSGNTLLGFRCFEPDCDFAGVRKGHKQVSAVVDGGQIIVVDSAGLSGEDLTVDQLVSEIRSVMDLADPGPHVFVIVVKIGRLSTGDSRVLQVLTRLIHGDISKHAAVLFTHGDTLTDSSLQDRIRSSPCVSELVSVCRQRLCVLDNTQTGDRLQVQRVLRLINDIIRENQGRHCSSDTLTTPEPEPDLRDLGLPAPRLCCRLWICVSGCLQAQSIRRTVVRTLSMLPISSDTYRYFY